jgi:hypothetical protein
VCQTAPIVATTQGHFSNTQAQESPNILQSSHFPFQLWRVSCWCRLSNHWSLWRPATRANKASYSNDWKVVGCHNKHKPMQGSRTWWRLLEKRQVNTPSEHFI